MAIIVRWIPDIAIEFITKEEDCVLEIYKDQVGYPTIGLVISYYLVKTFQLVLRRIKQRTC